MKTKNGKSGLRIWIDFTNAPHVLVLRPIIEIFKKQNHEVVITARDFSQTLPLLEKFGIDYFQTGMHRGKSIPKKILGLFSRTKELIKFARSRKKFDMALSHGSNDLAVAAFLLKIPHVTMFDYEYAAVAHHVNFRLSKKIMCPDIISKNSLSSYGGKNKIDQYPGLKEEYYLFGWKPNPGIVGELGLDKNKVIAVVRTPPDVSLYHRFENVHFSDVLKALERDDVQQIIIPRTADQLDFLMSLDLKNAIYPAGAIDAQSLIYYSDLVVSAGGTMNREAVVLGTPVYTLFSGKMGAIDKVLINEGKMTKLTAPSDIKIVKKKETDYLKFESNLRDPNLLTEKILKVVQ